MVGAPSVDLFVCDRSANQSRRGCARRPEQDRHGVREAGASSSLYPPQDRKGLSNTGFSGSFLRSRNTRQRRGRRGGRERFESSQEQQSPEAFVDHGVQTFFDPQVFEHLRNSCCFSQFGYLSPSSFRAWASAASSAALTSAGSGGSQSGSGSGLP
jgi:hypothetical protein